MGKYYNVGWSVADTNRLAFIVRRLDKDCPLDKSALHAFAFWVILNRRYRAAKLMSGHPYCDGQYDNVIRHEQSHDNDVPFYNMNINELTDDEWDFICELPVKEN